MTGARAVLNGNSMSLKIHHFSLFKNVIDVALYGFVYIFFNCIQTRNIPILYLYDFNAAV